jgi:glycosyltransferase involved in cell wall biosynthesis
MKKIAIVVSSPMMVNFFLIAQLNHLVENFEVTLITGPPDNNVRLQKEYLNKKIKIIQINMKRKMSIFSDLFAFFRLILIFYKYKFNIVHSVSPKSGLLAQLSAFFAGIKIRIHTFTGQVWSNKQGTIYYLLKLIDLLIVKVSSNILVDSYSQRTFLMNENILNHDNSRVLLNGSISGINEKRFAPSRDVYESFRKERGLSKNSKIILFIGRLTKDKGIVDLLDSFKMTFNDSQDCYLLLVGPDEDNIKETYLDDESIKSRIYYFKYTDRPEYFMQVSDILCLPSLREGFGNVVLEAALCGVPAIVSDIYGLRDVVEKDVTASIFKLGDMNDLSNSLLKLVSSDEKRLKMGIEAQKRAEYLFSSNPINDSLVEYYRELLGNNIKV